MLELIRHDGAVTGQLDCRVDVVVWSLDETIGDRPSRTVRVRIEDRDPVAQRARGEPEHPPELAAAQDADCRPDRDRRLGGRVVAQHASDERGLGHRVAQPAGDPGPDDLLLQGRVLGHQTRVVPERVAEDDLARPFRRVGDDVKVDLADHVVAVARSQAAEDQGPARRERVGVVLRLKTELEEQRRDPRDVSRIPGVDAQVDDALAGQAGHGSAAEMLHGQVGPMLRDELAHATSHRDRARVRRSDRQRMARVGADRRLGHVVECILGGPCED